MKISAIYKIQSIIHPDRIYIGSAVNINERWHVHLCLLRKGNHHSPKLQNHFKRHGESDLIFSVLLECPKENLITREQDFIDALSPWFNINKNAANRLGMKHSEKSKIQNAKSNKGKHSGKIGPMSEEHKQNIGKSHEGIKASKGTRDKMSKSRIGNTNNLGNKASKEARLNMSKSHIGNTSGFKKGQPSWNKGLKLKIVL